MDANGAAPVDSNNGGGSYAGTFNQTLSSKEMQDQFTYVRLTPTNVVQNGKAFPSLPHLQFLDGVGKNIDLQQRPRKIQLPPPLPLRPGSGELAGRERGPPTIMRRSISKRISSRRDAVSISENQCSNIWAVHVGKMFACT